MPNEDYALVLDYLPQGKSSDFKSKQLAQVIGTEFFTLLEVVPKSELKVMEKVYIGKDVRDKIELIKSRITSKQLTSAANSELEKAIESIVIENEKKFIFFFNNSSGVSLRLHKLELLPGIGHKHLQDTLAERKKKPFETFKEIQERIPLLPDPLKLIVKRIANELTGEEKYYLFTRPPAKPDFDNYRRPYPRRY